MFLDELIAVFIHFDFKIASKFKYETKTFDLSGHILIEFFF